MEFLEWASFWANVGVVLFTVIAAASAVIALYFGTQLSAAKDADFDRFKTESATAMASANARAAEANEKAAEAQQGTAKALAQSAKIELEAAQQRERAARAERALLELQGKVSFRRISEKQRADLVDKLQSVPKGPVTIFCIHGDDEGFAFASQILDVLKYAGWAVHGVNHGTYGPQNPVGLSVQVLSASKAPPYARALLEAFNSVGFKVSGETNSQLAESDVVLVVGTNPKRLE